MNKIFVISDTWFNRPGGKLEDTTTFQYNDTIIENWNKVVDNKDIVYVLGGLGIADIYPVLIRLNGQIRLLNSFFTKDDKFFRDVLKTSVNLSVDSSVKEKIIFEDDQIVVLPEEDAVLSYLPLSDWLGRHTGTYCFHGLNEDCELSNGLVSCMANHWNFAPICISEVKESVKNFLKNSI